MQDVQPGQALPWNVLPEGSYRHPYESGSRARTFPFVADASVELPLSATVFLTAEGSSFSGAVNIDDDGSRGANVVQMDIRMYYTAQQLSEQARAWRQQLAQGNDGIAIKVRPIDTARPSSVFTSLNINTLRLRSVVARTSRCSSM